MEQKYLDKLLATPLDDSRSLILGAFLDDKRRWNDKLGALISASTILNDEALICKKEIENKKYLLQTLNLKNGISKLLVCFKVRNLIKDLKKQKKCMNKLNKNCAKLIEEQRVLLKNAPEVDRYELALMGNDLFRAR